MTRGSEKRENIAAEPNLGNLEFREEKKNRTYEPKVDEIRV